MFKITEKSFDVFKSFKFKNLEFFNTFDGIAYSCSLYYGASKIADVLNNGDGGETSIDYTENGEKILDSLNIKQYHTDDGFEINNEYIISDLVEIAIIVKKSLRNQNKSILFFKDDSIYTIQFKSKLEDIAKVRKDIIINNINKIKNDGGIIINTNLDKLGI